MRTIRLCTNVMALSWVLAPAAKGEQQPSIEQIAAELKKVQAELLMVRIELDSARVGRLQNDHAAATKIRQRLEARERSSYDEVAKFDRQLGSTEITAEQRVELEIDRKVSLDNIAKARQQRAAAEQKEWEIAEQLRSVHLNLTVLLDRSRQQKP
jgi:hypothetical protein